ncbi:MAG: HAMP domain-containing protein [Treponema sp.]|jgi:adenylate cyclase|nr:HAMP domain-containing protein [Treponema sp.]
MKTNKVKTRTGDSGIRFPIGAKLILLISIIVILSLGSITVLVSWLVRGDLRISAEENNFETNRRSAMEAEVTIDNVRSHSRMLMQTIAAVGAGSTIAQQTSNLFFSENPQIVSVFFITPGNPEQLLVNNRFFITREIETQLAGAYFDDQRGALGRVIRGETVLLNAAPHFGIPVLALFFPLQTGGFGGVVFSSENLNQNFGYGINQSYMINSDGYILSHSDFSLVRSGVNISSEDFIREILDSPQKNRQQLIESDFRLLQSGSFDNENFPVIRKFVAFTRLNTAGTVVITSIEYDKVFEGIAATTRRNMYLTIAVLCISIIFIWFFSKTISIPLKALAYVARNIEGGVFEMDLKPKGRDEIGVLTNSFQKMCAALHIFGRFTNKEIAVKAMRGEIKPGGLPKHASIFFSDIRGFTAKSESFTNVFGEDASDRIVHWLNNYFTKMVDCVEKTNGVVDKFIGDAVMAHWGTAYSAGSPRKDAFNAVNAALMMRKALYELNKERDPDDPANPSIQIGCGINSGIVTAGQLGSDMRMEYTVIGDPVNLASRIEALTKPLAADILISEDTWLLTEDKFITEEMPSVSVKGKEKPVRIFAVINTAGNEKGPQTMADVRNLLGIEAPEISKVDVNADEKKYNINPNS